MSDHRTLLRKLPAQPFHSCPKCNSPVRCDITAGKSTCWCFGLQAKEVEHGDVCLCSGCLTQRPPLE
ncbi:cysteine-rich CWC family protein [Stutzerimonas stutzeri]|uniref:cysteine-rich CWC family protein n=1 Tax=Stutzerimonas stutzeri TaxID=316 RepID=UPI003C7C3A7A